MPRFPQRFWVVALLIAWAVDLLFWNKPFGVSFLVWVLLALLGIMMLARTENSKPARPTYLLMVLAILAAAVPLLRREGFTLFVNTLLALSTLALLAITYLSGFWVSFRLGDYIAEGFKLFIAAISRPTILFPTKTQSDQPALSSWKSISKKLAPVLRGLILALPVVLVLALLLAAADPIFNKRLVEFLKFFNLERLGEYLFRFGYILVFGYLLAGTLLHALLPKDPQVRPDPSKPWLKPFMGWIEAVVILVSVDLLFAIFVGIQFQYLFGGQANISTSGFTYSEYARRGFNELIAVAVISLVLYLSLSTITRQQSALHKRGFTFLSTTLMVLVLVILASAFQRLLMYESAYGFTQLRVYTHILIIWLAALLVAAILFEIMRRRGHFALALLAMVFGFCLTLPILNIDGFIARQNIERARQGLELDKSYLHSLSNDAVPTLIKYYAQPGLPPKVQQSLGIELACRTALLSEEKPGPWQGFNLSDYTASRSLFGSLETFSQYWPKKTAGQWVITVNGKPHECSPANTD